MDIMLSRIVECIPQKHGSKKELADSIGIPANVITAWLSGKNKSYPKYAAAIADYYNVSLDWLSGRSEQKNSAAPKNDAMLEGAIPYKTTGMAPVLGYIPAGYPTLATDDILGYEPVDVHAPEECFWLIVKGDSMINAGIRPGDMVLIRHQPCAENGQIVACRLNGDEATLKRFKRSGSTVVLVPENPAYQPRVVPKEDFESGYANIIGVVLESKRKYM